MRYLFLLLLITISGFSAFLFMGQDKRFEIIQNSSFTESPQLTIGALFSKNFGRHHWQDATSSSGKPVVLFTGIVLPQDSLRLNGAQINFQFTLNEQAANFTTDSVWWSYPESYKEKKRAELACFNDIKLRHSLKYLYAKPENLLVKNGNQQILCSQPSLQALFSENQLLQITTDLISKTPLAVQDENLWQTGFTADWDLLGWSKGEKAISFTPQAAQQIKTILRHNANSNSKLAYLNQEHPLDSSDSAKIFF